MNQKRRRKGKGSGRNAKIITFGSSRMLGLRMGPNEDEGCGVQLQDPRLTQAYQLDIEHRLDAIGTYIIACHLTLVAVYQCVCRIKGVHSR